MNSVRVLWVKLGVWQTSHFTLLLFEARILERG
jgi:hypothetical protein